MQPPRRVLKTPNTGGPNVQRVHQACDGAVKRGLYAMLSCLARLSSLHIKRCLRREKSFHLEWLPAGQCDLYPLDRLFVAINVAVGHRVVAFVTEIAHRLRTAATDFRLCVACRLPGWPWRTAGMAQFVARMTNYYIQPDLSGTANTLASAIDHFHQCKLPPRQRLPWSGQAEDNA